MFTIEADHFDGLNACIRYLQNLQKRCTKESRHITTREVFLIEQRYEISLMNEFFYMKQWSTVGEFYKKLNDVWPWMEFYCEGLSEIEVVNVFIRGLKQEIRDRVCE